MQDLLDAAEVPGTLTFVALDAEGLIVAVFQAAPEGSERCRDAHGRAARASGCRRQGSGGRRCSRPRDGPCFAGSVLFAAIDCQNTVSLRCFAACGSWPTGALSDGVRRIARVGVPSCRRGARCVVVNASVVFCGCEGGVRPDAVTAPSDHAGTSPPQPCRTS